MDRIERDVLAAQQACLIVSAMGGSPEWPSLDERIADFDRILVAEPERLDQDELELREALGLRRPGG